MRYFILMAHTPLSMFQIEGTGYFESATDARNFLKYNGHLFTDERGQSVNVDDIKIFEIHEVCN